MPTTTELYNEHEQLKTAGQLQEAIGKLTEALELDENFVMGHLGLAVLYGKVGMHDKAVFHAQTACTLEPNEPFNYTAMSLTMQRAFAGTGDRKYIQMAEDAMARSHQLQGQ